MMDRFAQRMLPVLATMAAISSAPTIARAADPAPHINYLDVGSASENSFVGIYGRGFGTQEGRIEFAGAASKDIALWTDNLIIARVPIGAQSGKLTLTSSDGNASTQWPVTFRVRAGHVYVVSSNGSDSDGGTEDKPFQSLYKARSVAKAGDTVMIRAGIYDEQNSGTTPGSALNITVGGSSSSPITWRGFGKELPVIRGTGIKSIDSPILYAGGSNLRLARLIVDGQGNRDSAVWIHGSSVWMTGVEVRNFAKTGVGIDEVSGVVLVNNHIHDGTTNPGVDHGIWMLGRQGTIRGNLVEDLPYGDGIRLEYSSQSSTNVFGNYVANIAGPGISLTRVGGGNRVYNNVLWKTGQTEGCRCALEVGYESDDGKVGQGDHIYFNTIVGPTYRGVFTAQRQAPVQLNSNLFASVQGGIIFDDQTSQDAMSCSHNLWSATPGHELLFQWDGSTKTFDEFQKASSKASGSFTAAPALADPENGDAHLTASSPAVDKAGGPDKTTLDFDGVSRPQGAASDIGAFELPNGSAAGAGGAGGAGGSAGEAGAAGNTSSGGEAGNAAGGQAQGGSAQAGSAGESGGDSAGGSSDGGGCGCSVPGHRNSIPEGWLLLGAAVAATMLRRRAR